MQARATKRASVAKQKYMTNFNEKDGQDPVFEEGDLVYLDINPSITFKEADSSSQKIRTKTTGSYRIITVQPSTVTVGKDGFLDTVSIDRVSIAQHEDECDTYPQLSQLFDELPAGKEDTSIAEGKPNEAEQGKDDYVVNKIDGHTVQDGQILYRVRWYGYFAEDDTAKAEENIPSPFIRCYRQRRPSPITIDSWAQWSQAINGEGGGGGRDIERPHQTRDDNDQHRKRQTTPTKPTDDTS